MASEAYDDYDDEELEPLDDPNDHPVTDEERAMAQGWKPRHLYRGPAENWTDAATFLQRGETELPILRDQNRRMSERLARVDTELETLRNTVAEQRQAVQDAISLAKRSNEAGYNRALKELEDERRAAVEAGDTVAFDQVQEQIEALKENRPDAEPPPPPPPEPKPAGINPAVLKFVSDNASWYNDATRPVLRNMMVAFHQEVMSEGQISDMGEQLEEAKARLIERYPDQTDISGEPAVPATPPRRPATPAARRAAAVASPRGAVPSGRLPPRGASPFEQIPAAERADAKAAYERMRRQDPELTAAEYCAMYVDPHADVLALRKTHRSK